MARPDDNSDLDTELVDDPLAGLELAAARGGRVPKQALQWEVLRSLRVPEDLPLLATRTASPRQSLTQIRHTHHQLARLLASGTEQAEASLITGYAPAYISTLKTDPSFEELIAYYSSQKEQIFVDVVERMRSLGLNTLDELQARIESDPDSWSRRELMELAELLLIKPIAATRGTSPMNGSVPVGGVSVNVKFVSSSESPSLREDASDNKIIEHEPITVRVDSG